jgi:hypothetical protein
MRKPRAKKLAAVAKAAELLSEASAQIQEREPFRADALLRLSYCLEGLVSKSTLDLTIPRGSVRLWEADGGRHFMGQTAGQTSGRLEVEAEEATPREVA